VQQPSTGNDPASSPLYWMEAAPSNRWAMWDAEISTASTVAGNLTATLVVPGRFNAVAFHGLMGSSITVTQKNAGGATLWTETRALMSNPASWYAYFYDTRQQVRQAVFTGLVPQLGSRIEVVIASTTTAACAAVSVGNARELGDAQYGATSGITSYSRKETSSAGVQTLRKGRTSKRMSLTLVQPLGQYNAVSELLESLDATAATWVGVPGSSSHEPLTILGFYRDFQIELPYPLHNLCSLEIEGLTTP
jgi:hypothetical protein